MKIATLRHNGRIRHAVTRDMPGTLHMRPLIKISPSPSAYLVSIDWRALVMVACALFIAGMSIGSALRRPIMIDSAPLPVVNRHEAQLLPLAQPGDARSPAEICLGLIGGKS